MADYIEITQTKSAIGRKPEHRGTLRALGLKRIRHTVVHEDTPVIRGMVNHVRVPRRGPPCSEEVVT